MYRGANGGNNTFRARAVLVRRRLRPEGFGCRRNGHGVSAYPKRKQSLTSSVESSG
jgi:hypothetical protein